MQMNALGAPWIGFFVRSLFLSGRLLWPDATPRGIAGVVGVEGWDLPEGDCDHCGQEKVLAEAAQVPTDEVF